MSNSLAVALSLTVAAGMAAHAQNVRTPVAPQVVVPGQADMMKFQTAMVAAQAAAVKPGDGRCRAKRCTRNSSRP